jgi:3-oxo-5-alpha-steroid 4-dehydrogenase 1
MGKTSTKSSLNLPGKIAWFTMEIPSIIILLTILFTLPTELGIKELPFENRLMAGLFVRALPPPNPQKQIICKTLARSGN